MTHDRFIEWLYLVRTDELDPADRQALEDHLRTCTDCRAEKERLDAFSSTLQRTRPVGITDELLTEARQQFRNALRAERLRRSWWEHVWEFLSVPIPRYAAAVGGAAVLIVGFFGGYLMVRSGQEDAAPLPVLQTNGVSSFSDEMTRVVNLQFLDSDASDGEVEFVFELVRPARMRGRLDDPAVQRVLAQALVSDRNPGVRLRSVVTLAAQVPEQKIDPEIKAALIAAVKTDDNAAVRKEALLLLARLPVDEAIKQALLHVLEFDRNAGLRIEAVKVLETLHARSEFADDAFLRALQETMAKEENNFIQIRAKALFEETQP